MSLSSVNVDFNQSLGKCLFCDFIIDSDDVMYSFGSEINYVFDKPNITLNKILLEDNIERISSITIGNHESEWIVEDKIEIDNCSMIFCSELVLQHLEELDQWLSECIKSKELYRVFEKGALYLQSGFGPGIYSLLTKKDNDNNIVAIKIEFIKETI
jgi:hypothetical protein